jgi:glycerophosphoryl diester phosphodiesterase
MLLTRGSAGVTSVIAHRGASRVEPENTVGAFRRAAELGADMVELDVRRSSDGALMVVHNAVLADGRAVCDVPAAELPRPVPTLAEALAACAGMTVDIEIKNDPGEPGFESDRGIAADVVDLVQRLGETNRVLVSSFDQVSIDLVRSLEVDVAVGWLVGAVPPDYLGVLTERDYQALHPWWEVVTPELISQCHALDVAVNCWTCDDTEAMVRLAGWGIDGICTNVPDAAVKALRRDGGVS